MILNDYSISIKEIGRDEARIGPTGPCEGYARRRTMLAALKTRDVETQATPGQYSSTGMYRNMKRKRIIIFE